METYYNDRYLLKITVSDSVIHGMYKYKESYTTGFFKKKIVPGVIYSVYFPHKTIDKNDLPKHLHIRDNKVFFKPCVTLQFLEGFTHEEYFESFDEAKKYAIEKRDLIKQLK